MRKIRKGEYLTTLEEYYGVSGRTMEDIANDCPTASKGTVFMAIEDHKKGKRQEVLLHVKAMNDRVMWAYTERPVFGFKDD